MIWQILILLVSGWILYTHLKQQRRKVNIPGPLCFPLVGAVYSISRKGYLIIDKWNQQYGKLVYFHIFGMPIVSVSDTKLGKELFSLDSFSGRPTFETFLMFEGEPLGVINSAGHLWEVHRRFTLRHLRDFGFGKNSMETLIMDEVNELMGILNKNKGKPFGGIKEKLAVAVVNSLWTVVSGKRYQQDDAKLLAITKNLNKIVVDQAKTGGILFFLPILKYIIPELCGYTQSRRGFESLLKFLEEAVKEHQRTYQPDTVRDFIDVYLKEMNSANASDPQSTFAGPDGIKQLMAVIGDLFFAGSDTTSTTLAWTILYMATYPEVQRRLQEEITAITGDSRDVSVADRPNMPYLQSVVEEILRFSAIVPNGVSHLALTDVTHKGVTYPKGTFLSLNIYHIHHSKEIWGDPENFRPERFLSSDEKTFKKNENVVSFSVGRRQCLGESLARDSIFLFTANIFQKYTVTTVPNEPAPSLEAGIGVILAPLEYRVIFNSRD